ncbi:MAG TPA: NAD(P)H-dependent oxidoreductase subunit E, partial [Candidatus Binataceae bacterium]|nr:NAD(P)H-dependent oxidoreductase subunit E [Candidatus Binataceae bacterium]
MGLSEQTLARIREEIGKFPNPRGALIGALHMARGEAGSLSREVYGELAPMFGMRVAEVAEVASFYSLFRQPPARAVIQVCTNLPCCIRGARSIVKELEQRLGIASGRATPDGRFAIQEVECLGSCSTAPVIQVNDAPYLENVAPEMAAMLTISPEEARSAWRPPPAMMSSVPDGV